VRGSACAQDEPNDANLCRLMACRLKLSVSRELVRVRLGGGEAETGGACASRP